MSLTFTTWQNQLANLMAASTADAAFQIMVPGAIDYGENRCYQDLDLQFTIITDASSFLTPGNRNFTLPINGQQGFPGSTFIVVNNVNIITPATTNAQNGSRVPLTPVSQAAMDLMWPSSILNTGQPQVYCRPNSTILTVGPSPDGAYVVEVIGTQRPTPLSASNNVTILTTYVPALFMAATMIYASGYMRNFGAQSDDPRMAASWEAQYTNLLKSAEVEQFRAKYQSQGYTSQAPSPVAAPRT